jgi:hypothetical protein
MLRFCAGLLAALLLIPAVCGCRSGGDGNKERDGQYVPPEQDRSEHTAPPRRPGY